MTLHMLHLPLRQRALMAYGRSQGLVSGARAVDDGYLVHALLARLFPPHTMLCFDLQQDDSGSAVLAYSRSDAAGLIAARSAADQAIGWDAVRSKQMPEILAGRTLAFRVRVCPVVRVGKRHPRFMPGAEVDPFVALTERERATREAATPCVCPEEIRAEVIKAGPEREEVYRAWLAARLHPAATLEQARMVALRGARLWRKGGAGTGAAERMRGGARPRFGPRVAIDRREAVFEGVLRVDDPVAFAALLARGVGRHRAFGYGMLLLRPVSTDAAC